MKKIAKLSAFIVLLLYGAALQAQEYRTDLSLDPQLTKIEQSVDERLSEIVQNLQNIAELIKKKDQLSARKQIKLLHKSVKMAQASVKNERYFSSMRDFLTRLDLDLSQSERSLRQQQWQVALKHIAQAYRRAQALQDAERPVLRITAAEMALDSAANLIQQEDYQSAAESLKQAIDYITEIQVSGPVNTPEMNKLKNDIIITQQQVLLGKLQDAKRLNNLVPGFEAARINTINSYYNIWNRTEEPWNYNLQ